MTQILQPGLAKMKGLKYILQELVLRRKQIGQLSHRILYLLHTTSVTFQLSEYEPNTKVKKKYVIRLLHFCFLICTISYVPKFSFIGKSAWMEIIEAIDNQQHTKFVSQANDQDRYYFKIKQIQHDTLITTEQYKNSSIRPQNINVNPFTSSFQSDPSSLP